MRYLSCYLPLKTLDQIYNMMIRPHLDHCDVIYHIPQTTPYSTTNSFSLNSLMEKIEKVQYNAALAITCTWRGSNRSKLYDELGWEALNKRRWSRRLIQFFKIHKRLSPEYLVSQLPATRYSPHGVRHPNVYREIFCKSNYYQNSFYPNSIKLWNYANL